MAGMVLGAQLPAQRAVSKSSRLTGGGSYGC